MLTEWSDPIEAPTRSSGPIHLQRNEIIDQRVITTQVHFIQKLSLWRCNTKKNAHKWILYNFFPQRFPKTFFFFNFHHRKNSHWRSILKKNQTNLKETLKWKTYADTQPNSLHNIRKQKESFATLQNWGCQNSLKIISLGWNKNFHRTVRNPENEPKWSEIWNILKCPNNESKHFLGYADWPIQTCNEANKSSLKESWRISEKSEEKKKQKTKQ